MIQIHARIFFESAQYIPTNNALNLYESAVSAKHCYGQ